MNRFSQNGNMQFLGSLLTWMGISLAISVEASHTSISMIVSCSSRNILTTRLFLIRKASRKMRNGYSENSVFDSLSSLFNSGGMANNRSLKYYCISCRAQHKQVYVQSSKG
jgi:hypothetical protein